MRWATPPQWRAAPAGSLDMPLRMEVTVEPQGFSGAASERPVWKLGGRISNGIWAGAEIHRRRAQVADEITPRVVGLVESEYLLATTGECNGRWRRQHPR